MLSIAVSLLAAHGSYANSIGQGNSACLLDGQDSCPQATAASLLQKVHQRSKRVIFTQEPLSESGGNYFKTTCTGTQALDRCWFLSELGKSCTTTCQKQNRTFLFVLPDPDDPVTPKLLGHEPATKNDAWGAIECYVPSEDRYHTANQNSAKHVEDIATWKHDNCKLACPCGRVEDDKCSWFAPPSCASEFMWKGIKYSGCASTDAQHDRPWCQHNFENVDGHNNNNFAQDWSYCKNSCNAEEPVLRKERDLVYPAVQQAVPMTVDEPVLRKEKGPIYAVAAAGVPPTRDGCGWIPAHNCVKEFDYRGSHYLGCSIWDLGTPWCSNTDQYEGLWNNCIYTCADKPTEKVPVYPAPSDVELCTWQPSQRCAGTYQYKGIEYTGCIEEDHPTPWCSIDRIHEGSWEICTRVCSIASGSVAPAREQSTPSVARIPYAVVPCQEHQGEDNALGDSVTLDEVGFKTTVAAGSALDMKRFVCRVVESIGCRVIDPSGLMTFVPYYTRTDSNPPSQLPDLNTYGNLKSTLSSLCLTLPTKWVMPRQP